ncbi:MAG: sulfatase activating formylglycine-generating enzyme [Planctomycetota bacterium]
MKPAPVFPDMPSGARPVLEVEHAKAEKPEDMQVYVDRILGSEVSFGMAPIPGGVFSMGSPKGESSRNPDEGPVHELEIAPFWMGTHEVTWDEYELFMDRSFGAEEAGDDDQRSPQETWADAVSRPTPPYVPMDFNMGTEGYPAISMTQFAAKQYTKWLSMKTGRFYRLATEAEWEYACRGGAATAYHFGDDASQLDDYAWYFENSKESYHPVGKKKPNPFGLFDMHGNVAEWVLDGHGETTYADRAIAAKRKDSALVNPIHWPSTEYSRVVRGGSWDDDPGDLRSAARRKSRESWKMLDPQLPKSIWYLTNARTVGFRLVRPLLEPSAEQQEEFWQADIERIAAIQERQRKGER